MTVFARRITGIFRPPHPAPPQYRQTFLHLYLDIAWFGMLSGSTIAFLAVYATRMGASTQQIGLLSAVPALVNLVFALPAGSWLARQPLGRAVFWASVLQRMFYLLLIPLPVMLMPQAQVWFIILATLLMTIPGTAMNVGFNSIFGEVVPLEWRGHVAGIRNAVVSVTATLFTLISGWILDQVAFPTGYQIVFAIGVIGAGMSSYHLYVLSKCIGSKAKAGNCNGSGSSSAQPRTLAGRRLALEMRAIYERGVQSLRLDVLSGHFARIMGLMFGWHLMQFMTIPIITPFVVNVLHVSDQTIGLANGLFNVTVFFGSLQLNRLTVRFGNKVLSGVGVMGLCVFPLLTALGTVGYVLANMLGGLAWALVGGAVFNYLLDNIPAEDRPAYLAWYTLISNGAILIGSMAGPLFAGQIGYIPALLLFGIGRLLAGVAILRWG